MVVITTMVGDPALECETVLCLFFSLRNSSEPIHVLTKHHRMHHFGRHIVQVRFDRAFYICRYITGPLSVVCPVIKVLDSQPEGAGFDYQPACKQIRLNGLQLPAPQLPERWYRYVDNCLLKQQDRLVVRVSDFQPKGPKRLPGGILVHDAKPLPTA